MRVTLGAKVFAGFLIVLVSFAGVSGYALYRLGQLRESFRLVSGGYLRLSLLANDIDRLQSALVGQVASGAVPTPRMAHDTDLLRKQRVDRTRRAAALAREAGLAEIARAFDDLGQRFAEMDPLYLTGEWDRIARVESTKLRHDTTDLKKDVSLRAQKLAGDLEEEERRQVWWLLGLVSLATLIGALVTFGAHLSLRPLVRMTARMRRIASGEEPLGEPFAVAAEDEIGELARAWNQLAAALRERQAAALRAERLAAVGRMAAHITHEIRNPLSAIGLNTELLGDEVQGGSPEAARLVRAIGAEVDRLTGITEEYLRFARLPRPRLELEDLGEVVQGGLELQRAAFEQAGVALEVTLAAARVRCDEGQLRQVLLNLLRNALEATPRGGRVSVLVRAGDEAELSVSDTGPGLPDEAVLHLFEPFFTTKERGTGLGLALAQQIVVEHGGTLRCERAPSGGARFVVTLPVARDRDDGESAPGEDAALHPAAAQGAA